MTATLFPKHFTRRLLIAAFPGTAVACAGGEEPKPPPSIGSTLPPPADFRSAETCTPLSTYMPPTIGTVFTYEGEDGSRSSREILTIQDGRVRFQYRRQDANSPPLPPREAIAGLFVVHGPSANRRVDYSIQPIALLETLRPGQTRTIPTAETSTIRGRAKRIEYPTTIRFRGCGQMPVDGRPMSVRVYDISTARRVVDRSGKDGLRYSAVTYYLAADIGYPVAFQDTETAIAVRIDGA